MHVATLECLICDRTFNQCDLTKNVCEDCYLDRKVFDGFIIDRHIEVFLNVFNDYVFRLDTKDMSFVDHFRLVPIIKKLETTLLSPVESTILCDCGNTQEFKHSILALEGYQHKTFCSLECFETWKGKKSYE